MKKLSDYMADTRFHEEVLTLLQNFFGKSHNGKFTTLDPFDSLILQLQAIVIGNTFFNGDIFVHAARKVPGMSQQPNLDKKRKVSATPTDAYDILISTKMADRPKVPHMAYIRIEKDSNSIISEHDKDLIAGIGTQMFNNICALKKTDYIKPVMFYVPDACATKPRIIDISDY
jgi:hypothetical protein